MEGDAKSIAQRRSQQTWTSCSPDQRELLEPDFLSTSDDALADHEIKLVILHRRVKFFFNRRIEAVDLVDEEHIAFFQVSQLSYKITRYLNGRSCS